MSRDVILWGKILCLVHQTPVLCWISHTCVAHQPSKSVRTLVKEAELQHQAAAVAVAPRVVGYDSSKRCIVMEVMQRTARDAIRANDFGASDEAQVRLVQSHSIVVVF